MAQCRVTESVSCRCGRKTKSPLSGVSREAPLEETLQLHPCLVSPIPVAIRTLGQTEAEDHHVRVLSPGTGHDPLHGVQV